MKWDTLIVCFVMITLKFFDVMAINDLKARVEKLEQRAPSSLHIDRPVSPMGPPQRINPRHH